VNDTFAAEAAVMKFVERLSAPSHSTVARIRAVIVPSVGMRATTFRPCGDDKACPLSRMKSEYNCSR
jgi:hypothetical protein